jgi:hypothetical protein
LDFCQLPAEDQWQERVQGTGLGRNKATFAANTAKECGKLPATRYGGTFMISTGETVNHVVEEGEDFTGLGRFAYQIVQGKHGHRTVFASGYTMLDDIVSELWRKENVTSGYCPATGIL